MGSAEEAVYLWDNQQGTVQNGRNYAEGEEGVAPSLSSQ